MTNVAQSWQTIEKVLWENAHSLFQALQEPATETQIASLAKQVPVELPPDFVESLRVHDGIRECWTAKHRFFDYNSLLPISQILENYTMMCDLQDECGFGGGSAGADPGVHNDMHWRPGWVPIMDSDGDKIVLDLDPAPGGSVGQILDWSNTGSTPLRVLAPSFGAWLAQLAEALGQRYFHLDESGGIWLGWQPSLIRAKPELKDNWVRRLTDCQCDDE